VNGETHAVEQVLRCTVDEDLKEGSLDLAAVADGGQLQLLMLVEFADQLVAIKDDGMEPKTLQSQSVTLQGPAANGLWTRGAGEAVIPPNFSPVWTGEGGEEIDGPLLSVAGDQLTGTMTLKDFNGGSDTTDVSVELSIPPEAVDCSL
jgi:hypothetical protein